jgi:hypothetical protein
VLHAENRASREVCEHRVPVERAAEREPQNEAAVGREPVSLVAASPQCPRRLAKRLLAGAVELAKAAEAGGEGDLGDRQIGVVEQPARVVDPRRARKAVWRHAEVLDEEAAEVPR